MSHFSKAKLEEVANNSLYTSFTNSRTITYSFDVFKRFIKHGSILELGPAEGLMTERLISLQADLTVIEGSEKFAADLRQKFTGIKVVHSLFEDAELSEVYDNVVLGHVLEHVEDPKAVLQKVKQWLKPDGLVLCAVPNARSIHRQAAVEMGLIESIFDMSKKDVHHGHLRIYTPELLRTEFIRAGFKIEHFGGYWMKPLSDSQIEQCFNENMLSAFMKLGEFYPDIAAEIYIVCKIS